MRSKNSAVAARGKANYNGGDYARGIVHTSPIALGLPVEPDLVNARLQLTLDALCNRADKEHEAMCGAGASTFEAQGEQLERFNASCICVGGNLKYALRAIPRVCGAANASELRWLA